MSDHPENISPKKYMVLSNMKAVNLNIKLTRNQFFFWAPVCWSDQIKNLQQPQPQNKQAKNIPMPPKKPQTQFFFFLMDRNSAVMQTG